MPEMTFGHVADETAIRTGLLQTGTCNLAPMAETEEAPVAPAVAGSAA